MTKVEIGKKFLYSDEKDSILYAFLIALVQSKNPSN